MDRSPRFGSISSDNCPMKTRFRYGSGGFTLPSRYYFAIGHPGVFSLARWSLLIHTGFHVPHATRQHDACIALPQPRFHGLGCSHFARRYYGNRFCFLFLWLLRCFSSPGCLLPAHGFSSSSKGCPIRESPDLCLFSTPRSISSITTPFLVSGCLGIHRKPFLV
ncbi:unnamed protein product [Withania somnifera]